MKNKFNNIAWIFLGLSVIGFLDASYLTVEHFLGGIPSCGLLNQCETVTKSVYSEIFGIPVALLGSLYYLSFIFSTIAYFDLKEKKIIRYLSLYSICGFLFSAWFVYIQIFVLHAICEYCMLSAISSTSLFISGMYSLSLNEKNI